MPSSTKSDVSKFPQYADFDPDRRCPKCNSDDLFTSYVADSHGYECWGHEVPQPYDINDRFACARCGDEHFHRGCRRCHHKWREQVAPPGRPTRADLIASYEMKVQDFAAETRRVSLHREALGWVLYQYMHQQPYHRIFEDGTSPAEVLDIIRSVRDAGLPPPRVTTGATATRESDRLRAE